MLGQEHVVRALTHALSTGRLHHAYLFTGTRGVGKTTLARILAKCLNCAEGVGPTPCGVCQPCRDIDAGRFTDLIEVDAATNTRVEEMRDLLDNSQYRPVTGRFKVYIIDEVHMLSRHAFNAMLKTLEEPPAHMKFILATTDPQKVPVTVLSRCLQFSLKPMTVEQLISRLAHILQAEGVPFELPALRLVARAAHGSVRDSLSLLDQAIAFGHGQVAEAPVAELLGVVAEDAVLRIAAALGARDGVTLLAEVQRLIDSGQSAEVLLQDFGRLMQRIALLQLVPGVVSAAGADPGAAALAALAGEIDVQSVQLCYQIALASRRDLAHAPDEAAGLTMSFLRMLAFLQSAATPSGGDPVSGLRRSALTSHAAVPAGPGRGAATARAGAPGASAAPHPALPPSATGSAVKAAAAAPPDPAAQLVQQVAPGPAVVAGKPALPDSREDWLALVDRLPAAGVALELARHSHWKGRQGQRLQLGLATGHQTLLAAQERLCGLLTALLGPVQLELIAEAPGAPNPVTGSAAARDQAVRAQQRDDAERAIAADPVVQALTGQYGGVVVRGSAQPRDAAA